MDLSSWSPMPGQEPAKGQGERPGGIHADRRVEYQPV